MNWKEISHEDGHVLVEYANGLRLNIRYSDLIERNDPDRVVSANPVAPSNEPTARVASFRYHFKLGQVLPEHAHDESSLHDVLVEQGKVIVRKETGDVAAREGDRITLKIGERHSIEAITDAVTLHTLVDHLPSRIGNT